MNVLILVLSYQWNLQFQYVYTILTKHHIDIVQFETMPILILL